MQANLLRKEASALASAEAVWDEACDFIAQKEYDLVTLQDERVKLSPRAIEHGWSLQLDADVKQNRQWVTEGKEKALFLVSISIRSHGFHQCYVTMAFCKTAQMNFSHRLRYYDINLRVVAGRI